MFPFKQFIIKKTITSSDIKTATKIDLTAPCYGEFYVRDVVVKTDSTGLATGTNLVVYSTNAKGSATVLSTAISGLGANATINIDTASVTKQKTVMESGTKLQLYSTSADCTGAGTVDVYLILDAISSTSYIQ